jgi:hypothetical protein
MVNARPDDPDTAKAPNINVLPGFANSCGEPTYLNPVAEVLSDWSNSEAAGLPLPTPGIFTWER